jgi:hypothetical protein
MGWFNYPEDPEPVQLAYYRDRKLKAHEIDPGIQAADIARLNHPSNGGGKPGRSAISRSRTHGKQEHRSGSSGDSFLTWLLNTNRR